MIIMQISMTSETVVLYYMYYVYYIRHFRVISRIQRPLRPASVFLHVMFPNISLSLFNQATVLDNLLRMTSKINFCLVHNLSVS